MITASRKPRLRGCPPNAQWLRRVHPDVAEVLQGPPVSLRRIRSVEALGQARWLGWLNDRLVRRHLESCDRWTPARLQAWLKGLPLGTRLYQICFGDRPVGTLKLEGVGPGLWANVGLMVGDRSVWGRGIGTQALLGAVGIARRARCRGLWAGIREANGAAWKAFQRAGFEEVVRKSGMRPHLLRLRGRPLPAPLLAAVQAWPPAPPRVAVLRRFR